MMNVIGEKEFAPAKVTAKRDKVVLKFDPCVSCPQRGDECFETFKANACKKAVEVVGKLESLTSYARN